MYMGVLLYTHKYDLVPWGDVGAADAGPGADQSVYRNVRNALGWDGDTEKKREREREIRPGH